jgi:hypothetical protein
MKTFQDFITEVYGRSSYSKSRTSLRPAVRGRDYEDYKDRKPLPDFSKFQGGYNVDHKKEAEKNRRADTEKRMNAAGKKLGLPEDVEIEEGIGMTVANAIGNPPPLSKRMVLKRKLISREIEKNSQKNKTKKYSGKAAATEEYVQELFITRKSPEQKAEEKRKKKVTELIRLMKHAKDSSSDVAKTKAKIN